jgi:hypothetical protein
VTPRLRLIKDEQAGKTITKNAIAEGWAEK